MHILACKLLAPLVGKEKFKEALLDGTLEGFFQLIEQFNTQDEPAFCGLASLAMVLNTLHIDPASASINNTINLASHQLFQITSTPRWPIFSLSDRHPTVK